MKKILLVGLIATAAAAVSATEASLPRPDDDTLASWVKEAVVADPRVSAEGVEIAAEAGVVTLRGSVPTLAGKRYGLLAAQRIRGVVGVIDQIDVDVVERPNAELASDVKRRLQLSRAVEAAGLEVSASAGRVGLSGRVASWSQRIEAELLASEVLGVRQVRNQIVVETATDREDGSVQADVEAALRRDVYLVGLPIRVRVEQGAVTLAGAVSAPYEKTRAATQAGRVPGVRTLENQIRVEWWPDRSARVAQPAPLDDAALTAMVRAELIQDDRIDASGIEVAASRGRVTLSGRAASERQLRLALEDARNVVGVGWVVDALKVAFEPRPDDELRAEIEGAFATDSALFESEISVAVESGHVVLEGRVGSGYHRAHAAAIASRLRGVREVENRLRSVPAVIASDERLAKELEHRLARDWRTGPVAARITVSVEEGVVTLTGDVDRLSERNAAAQVARRLAGVLRVLNRLVVDPLPYPWEEPPDPSDLRPGWDPYWDFPDVPWVA